MQNTVQHNSTMNKKNPSYTKMPNRLKQNTQDTYPTQRQFAPSVLVIVIVSWYGNCYKIPFLSFSPRAHCSDVVWFNSVYAILRNNRRKLISMKF